MKVPNAYVGRTRPSPQGMDYLSSAGATPDAFGAAIGRGLQGLGAAFELRSRELDARADKVDRFSSLTNFSEFTTATSEGLAELKRNADPTGAGFKDSAEAYYEKAEQDFLNNRVTPELRDEFKYRSTEVRGRIMLDAMDFQYKQGDAYFRTGIDVEYKKMQKSIDPRTEGDPAGLENAKAHMTEVIDKSDLSVIEKTILKQQMALGLESVVYRDAMIKAKLNSPLGIPESIGTIIDTAADRHGVSREAMRTIAWIESKGNPSAKNSKSSAGGLFQQIDSNAAQYGVGNRFDAAESAEGAAKFMADNARILRDALGREPSVGELYLAHQQGPAGAKILLKNPNLLAVDVLGRDKVIKNGGGPGQTAQQFADMWINKANKLAGENPDLDSRYANVPYETRVALNADAETAARQQQAQDTANVQLLHDTQLNTALSGAFDGTYGRADLEEDRDNGTFTDYNDIARIDGVIEARRKGVAQTAAVTAMLASPGNVIANPNDEDFRKGYNGWFQAGGGNEAFPKMDSDYVANQYIPAAQKLKDVPIDSIGMLDGMVRSTNQQQRLWGLDVLRQLEIASPDAYADRVPDDLQKKVDFYNEMKATMNSNEILEKIDGPKTPEGRRAIADLRKTSQEILASKKDGVSQISTLVQDILGDEALGGNGGFGYAPLVGVPAFAAQFQSEYQTLFTEGYANYFGSLPEAEAIAKSDEFARKGLAKDWGVTEVGGQSMVMKNPPEKAMYKPILGSYDWMTKQGLEDLNGGSPLPTEGVLQAGNIDLANRPQVKNADGSISTVRSASFNIDGQEVLIPTVAADGSKILTNEEALKQYKDTGQFLGKFSTPEAATAYAEALHDQQDRMYLQPKVTRFELISDDTTDQQVRAYKGGLTTTPPSYLAVTYDEFGTASFDRDAPRIYFEPTAVDKIEDAKDYERRDLQGKLDDATRKLRSATIYYTARGAPVPPEFQENYDELKQQYDATEPAPVPSAEEVPPAPWLTGAPM